MKKLLISVLLVITSLNGFSTAYSDSLRVSLLTISPGSELYSVFGHTAVRIKDLKGDADYVFNYGTFNFNTPNFYLKFALGGLDYMVSVETFDHFYEFYVEENRTVIEQILNINKEQKLKLAELLITNYQPENRFYRYKFFTDNCSTRIRDIIASATGDSDVLLRPAIDSRVTFHKLYTTALVDMPWSKFGISLLLGSLTNEEAGYNALFLPDNLMKAVDKATLNGKQLVENNTVIFEAKPVDKESMIFSPILLAIIILICSILIQIFPNMVVAFDRVFFAIFGLLGLFVATLSIFSHHAELQSNFVLLFLLPTHILIPFLLKKKNFMKYYFASALIVSGLSFLLLSWIPQTFNSAFIIIAVAILIRLLMNFRAIIKARF
jgi:hypothetical protein